MHPAVGTLLLLGVHKGGACRSYAAVNINLFDILVMILVGLLGFAMLRSSIPSAPLLIAFYSARYSPMTCMRFNMRGMNFVVLNVPLHNSGLESEHVQGDWLEQYLQSHEGERFIFNIHYPRFLATRNHGFIATDEEQVMSTTNTRSVSVQQGSQSLILLMP